MAQLPLDDSGRGTLLSYSEARFRHEDPSSIADLIRKLKALLSDIGANFTELYAGAGGTGSLTWTARPASVDMSGARSTYNNTGAFNAGQSVSGDVNYTLWTPQVGDTFAVAMTDTLTTGTLKVTPTASTIGLGASGQAIQLLDVGTTVKLRCLVAGQWVVEFTSGDFNYV